MTERLHQHVRQFDSLGRRCGEGASAGVGTWVLSASCCRSFFGLFCSVQVGGGYGHHGHASQVKVKSENGRLIDCLIFNA